EGHVARGRADHDQIDLLRLSARPVQRLLRGSESEVRRGLRLVDDVPFVDSGALDDPLVGRVDHLLEILVGEDPLRRVGADADDLGSRHSRPPSRPSASIASASSAVLMCSFTSFLTHSAATRTPFLMAFTGDAPWQMMEA